jgi:hypothetical protein
MNAGKVGRIEAIDGAMPEEVGQDERNAVT